MTAKWLALRSLRRNQALLKAINTLSLHLQLRLEGHESDVQTEALAAARTTLVQFLAKLETGLAEADASATGLIYGADPRFQALVESYQARQAAGASPLVIDPVVMSHIIETAEPTDPAHLVAYLATLRSVVETQINQDIEQAL